MKINLTKKQYENLITMSGISTTIFGLLSDAVEEGDYKARSKEMDELETYLLGFAKEFGREDLVFEFEGKPTFDDDVHEEQIIPIIDDFEEYAVHTQLSNKLAWRDFEKEHTEEEMEKIAEEHGGYLGVALYDYEKKYWDEFEKYGFERLVVDEGVKGAHEDARARNSRA